MRNLLKSAGFVLYFLIAQCLATVGFIVYKIYADKEWMNALCNTLETSGAMSTEYLKLICEICLPMLVIADIIIIIPLICRTIVKREIFLRKPSVLCMLNMISLGLLLNFNVSTIITILPQSAVTSKYDSLMEMAMNGGILLSVLSSAILAPIAEELIFRYGICGVAYRKNWKFGMILSAAMFGVMHMNPIQSTYAFLMGLVLAYVYIKSDYNLLISIMNKYFQEALAPEGAEVPTSGAYSLIEYNLNDVDEVTFSTVSTEPADLNEINSVNRKDIDEKLYWMRTNLYGKCIVKATSNGEGYNLAVRLMGYSN